jgi:hypothetical protein
MHRSVIDRLGTNIGKPQKKGRDTARESSSPVIVNVLCLSRDEQRVVCEEHCLRKIRDGRAPRWLGRRRPKVSVEDQAVVHI